jgi:hypothetical protein
MALIDDLIAATDHASIPATTALNAAIDKINATRANIVLVNDAADLGEAQTAVEDEEVTALAHIAVPTIGKTVGTAHGPAAMTGTTGL